MLLVAVITLYQVVKVMIHVSGLSLRETCEIFKVQSKIMNMKMVRARALGHAHK